MTDINVNKHYLWSLAKIHEAEDRVKDAEAMLDAIMDACVLVGIFFSGNKIPFLVSSMDEAYQLAVDQCNAANFVLEETKKAYHYEETKKI